MVGMRRISKGIATFLSCFAIFLFMQSFVTGKAEELDTPAVGEFELPYQTIRSATCDLSISSGTASVSTVINGKSGTTSISATVYLEILEGGMWHVYISWPHSGGTDIDTTDSIAVSHGVYRVRMSVSATGSNGNDSFSVNGNTVGY
jgi:hypothetical protein